MSMLSSVGMICYFIDICIYIIVTFDVLYKCSSTVHSSLGEMYMMEKNTAADIVF